MQDQGTSMVGWVLGRALFWVADHRRLTWWPTERGSKLSYDSYKDANLIHEGPPS